MSDLIAQQTAQNLSGATATDTDILLLRSSLDPALVSGWLANMLKESRLAGVCFSLDPIDDMSGQGAELLWLTPSQIVSEATACEPGTSVVPLGYIPIGGCAEGSGDLYFLDLREGSADPPLVRVPHDFAATKPYPLDRVELVSKSLSAFFTKARF